MYPISPLTQPKTLLHARLFVVSHPSLEVGVRESLWLLTGRQDPDTLSRWRLAWRISIHDVLCHVDCQAEFTKHRYVISVISTQAEFGKLAEIASSGIHSDELSY